jgi:membrane protease YdiL (CAAX protease family)
MTDEQRTSTRESHLLTKFFVVTYFISWALWVPTALSSQGIISIGIPSFFGIVIGGTSPSLTAITLTIVEEGKEGLQDLFARLFRWRIPVQWCLFALFTPALTMLCAIALNALLLNTPFELPKIGDWAAGVILFPFTLILGGPLGEEIGWRGYVLPRLLITRNALLASLIVGAAWGLWHLPLFWIRGSVQAGVPISWFMVSILAESILYTLVHIHTRGSLLLVILFHAAINTWAKLILLPRLTDGPSPLLLTFGLEIILAVVVVVLVWPRFLSNKAL